MGIIVGLDVDGSAVGEVLGVGVGMILGTIEEGVKLG